VTTSKRPSLPRVTLEDLPPVLADRLRPRFERLGYLGEFFQVGAAQPDALAGFVDFSEAAKDALPDRIVELVALAAATTLGNDYERHQHEQLAVRLGLTTEWIAAAEHTGLPGPALTPTERQVHDLVHRAIDRDVNAARLSFDRIVTSLGTAEAVAVLFLLGRYLAHSTFVTTVGIEPPVPSIWETNDGC